jgi:uncharacterized membrane protein
MYWPLIGILIVIVGFALRFNALIVVAVAGLASALAAGISFYDAVAKFGVAFVDSRSVLTVLLTLPIIGVLERNGLRVQAKRLIGRIKAATTGRVLVLYLFVRQAAAALGLNSLGGHAQMVRPLIAPMAEGAARNLYGDLPEEVAENIRANAAAVDNIGNFFAEDVFVSIGSILLMKNILDKAGFVVPVTSYAWWAVPTAIAAFIIHTFRLWRLDRKLKAKLNAGAGR